MTTMCDFVHVSTAPDHFSYAGTHSPVWRICLLASSAEVSVMQAAAPDAEVEEDQDVRAYVSALWADDWDSPEDQFYDAM